MKKCSHFLGVWSLSNISRCLIWFLAIFISCGPMVARSLAVPLENALDKGQAKNHLGMNRPWDGVPPVYYGLNPQITGGINEPHPLPVYISRKTYNQLLNIEPVDQVQSRMFNRKLFESLQRIGVLGFENKTVVPFDDKNAGEVISRQAYQELKTNKKYSNIVPPQMMEDARIKIVKTLGDYAGSKKGHSNSNEMRTELVSTDTVDAVLVGAVSKYSYKYRDRRGNIKKSIASGLEFSAFLVDPKTQEVIWGARFVGGQKSSLRNVRRNNGVWQNKEGLSRVAMKYVLKEFRNRD